MSVIDRTNRSSILQPGWLAQLEPYKIPLLLLGACLLAYSLLAPRLGFYWDGWPFAWIAKTYGSAGLTRYFSTNRPVWGWLYQLTTPLFGTSSFAWQMFGVVTRWTTGLAFWLLLKRIWPEQKEAAAWGALLFVLYPGFGQSSIANMYSQFYIVLSISLISLWLHLTVIRSSVAHEEDDPQKQGKRLPDKVGIHALKRWKDFAIILLSLALAAYALFATEYFFGLELLRPFLIFMVLPHRGLGDRFKRTFFFWLPYAILILAYAYWRIFVLTFQTYDPVAIATAKPAYETLMQLGFRIASDIVLSGIGSWIVPITKFIQSDWASRFTWIAALLVLSMSLVFLVLIRRIKEARSPFAWQAVVLGLFCLVLSGLPVWAIGLPIRFSFPNDRLTLPMMSGAAMLIIGMGYLALPAATIRRAVLAILAGLALGSQLLTGVEYTVDWKTQQSFFWQLMWRAPDIRPGTILISNELYWLHVTDNSLVAPINWLYASGVASSTLEYYVAFVPLRTNPGSFLDPLVAGRRIHSNYLVTDFEGSTDDVLTLYFKPPRCLRVLDPIYDRGYPQLLPDIMKAAMRLSNPKVLITTGNGIQVPAIFGPEPSHDSWCYYFEKADLARQQGDWATVVKLGDVAFTLDESPNHATERLPFIEGYAMTGNWQAAEDQSRQTLQINRFTKTMLCSLWERVQANSTDPNVPAITEMTSLFCD